MKFAPGAAHQEVYELVSGTTPPGDATSLSAAVRGLWSEEVRRRGLGAAARREAEMVFSDVAMVRALESVLRTSANPRSTDSDRTSPNRERAWSAAPRDAGIGAADSRQAPASCDIPHLG